MHSNLAGKIEKIVNTFNKMDKLPKALMKYGCISFLILFAIGNVMVLMSNTILIYDSYFDFVSKSLVKVSFSIAAEAIIGSLILDFIFKK